MDAAGRTLEVFVHEPEPPRATIARTLLGPLSRVPARYEVVVVDRTSRAVVLRTVVDRSRHDADALAAVMRDDLDVLDERAFLKRHGRSTGAGRSRRRPW